MSEQTESVLRLPEFERIGGIPPILSVKGVRLFGSRLLLNHAFAVIRELVLVLEETFPDVPFAGLHVRAEFLDVGLTGDFEGLLFGPFLLEEGCTALGEGFLLAHEALEAMAFAFLFPFAELIEIPAAGRLEGLALLFHLLDEAFAFRGEIRRVGIEAFADAALARLHILAELLDIRFAGPGAPFVLGLGDPGANHETGCDKDDGK